MNLANKVLIGLLLGVAVGLGLNISSLNIMPWVDQNLINGVFHVGGKLFINGLKMVVVPLVLFSLIPGIVGIGDIEVQTRQTLSNVEAVLREAGASWDDVLKCNVYLKDMKDFQRMNEIFSEIFPDRPPARTTVQTPMAEEIMLVEIEAVAYIGD